jgi:hypothetical protein
MIQTLSCSASIQFSNGIVHGLSRTAFLVNTAHLQKLMSAVLFKLVLWSIALHLGGLIRHRMPLCREVFPLAFGGLIRSVFGGFLAPNGFQMIFFRQIGLGDALICGHSLLHQKAGAQHSQSPMTANGRAVMVAKRPEIEIVPSSGILNLVHRETLSELTTQPGWAVFAAPNRSAAAPCGQPCHEIRYGLAWLTLANLETPFLKTRLRFNKREFDTLSGHLHYRPRFVCEEKAKKRAAVSKADLL